MNYDSNLAPVTSMPFARDQILANAVALYAHLVESVLKARPPGTIHVEAKEVFQVLTTHDDCGWTAVLVYGVPRIEGTLARGDTVWSMTEAIKRLLQATSVMLGLRCHDELHIPRRSVSNAAAYGRFNKDFL